MSLWNTVGGIGYALDTPGALLRGLLAGAPGKRKSGRQLLETYGLLGKNTEGLDAGDVAGFAADVVLDPINLLGGAAVGKLAKILSAAKKAKLARNTARTFGASVADDAAASVINNADDVKRAFTQGTKWTGDHYARKLNPATGNVTNPESGLSLWRDPQVGQADLARITQRAGSKPLPITETSIPTMAGAYQAPLGQSVDAAMMYNQDVLAKLPLHDAVSTGVHEGMHAVTRFNPLRDNVFSKAMPGNMNDALVNYLTRATAVGRRRLNKRVGALRSQYDAARKANARNVYAPLKEGESLAKRFNYLSQPSEVYARIAQLRHMMSQLPKDDMAAVLGKGRDMNMWSGRYKNMSSAPVDELREVLGGDRMIRHLLKVLPLAPVAAVPAVYSATNGQTA